MFQPFISLQSVQVIGVARTATMMAVAVVTASAIGYFKSVCKDTAFLITCKSRLTLDANDLLTSRVKTARNRIRARIRILLYILRDPHRRQCNTHTYTPLNCDLHKNV